MRIAHVSDVHLRNHKRHDEYRRAFAYMYDDLRRNVKPDFIVDTGDLAHTKTQISPEFVDMCVDYHRELSSIAPVIRILGNHDCNMMNPDRQDAISPVISSLRGSTVHPVTLMKQSGRLKIADGFYVWAYSMVDDERFPSVVDTSTRENDEDVYIGLFHGSIVNCVTDQDWKMTSAEQDLTLFGGCDYVLMGDIHKQQFFGDARRIGYAGSLIQQNFGETPDKGYLVWDIKSRREHTVEHRRVLGAREFHTVTVNPDLSLPRDVIPPPDSRLRIVAPRGLTLVEQKNVERQARDLFRPHDVISITSPDTSFVKKREPVASLNDLRDIRSLAVQDKLMREFLESKSLSPDVLDTIVEMNRRYQSTIESEEDVVRNVSWRVNKLAWTNMFNYGENNVVDFAALPGLTGIFAPNTAGKSSIFEVFMEALFDKVTKDVSKNIELINDNRDVAKMVVDISVGSENFVIERTIERIKYGSRKNLEKEWGKTSLELYDEHGVSLNGISRPETERAIRRRIGTFEDFVLTTVSSQEPISGLPGGANLLMCKETDRKRILFRFLDLDIFDQKCMMAKDEAREHTSRFKELEGTNVAADVELFETLIAAHGDEMLRLEVSNASLELSMKVVEKQMMDLSSQIVLNKFEPKQHLVILERDLTAVKNAVDDNNVRLGNARGTRKKRVSEMKTVVEMLKTVPTNYEEKTEKFTALSVAARSNQGAIERFERLTRDSKKRLTLLDEVPCGDSYPGCKFLVDAFSVKKQLPADERELSLLYEERRQLHDALITLDYPSLRLIEEAKKHEKDRDKLERLILDDDRAVLELERQQQLLEERERKTTQELHDAQEAVTSAQASDEATTKLRELEKSKRELTVWVADNNKKLMSLSKQLGADTAMLQRLRSSLSELETLKRTCQAYECYVEAMGKHGIAYKILAEKLPVINDEINKILSNVVDFSVSIEHDEQEQTMKLYLQYGDYRSRNLALASGAEKFIASLAIRAALLNVSSLPKTNMFIVDEGFGKLDVVHLEAIQRMFDYLRSVFEHVIVISHVDTLKDFVDNHVEITSDVDGYAHISVEQ